MKLLDACLSMALMLALFASSATVLVELAQRALRMRINQLRALLGVAFDRHLATPLATAGADVSSLRTSFVEAVSQTRGVKRMRVATRKPAHAPTANELENARPQPVTSATIDDVLRRLAHNDKFRAIFAGIDTETLREMLESLNAGFARLEADASTLFSARARLLSYGCGIFLAFTVNIDAVRLLEYYASDPAESAKTVAALSAARPTIGSTDTEAEKQIATTMDSLPKLQASGMPVGLGFYPYCQPPAGHAQFDPLCIAKPDGWQRARHFGFWLACVLVTGFLIGLGGPYWFDIATSLMQWRNLLLDLARRHKEEAPATSATAEPPVASAVQWIDEIVKLGTQTPGSGP